MKIVKIIFQYILTIILALFVVALIVINIMTNTIFDSEYVISKLEDQDYFSQIYEDAVSAFENYIPPSGLEETVLDGIISEEKIRNDTETIIKNIYDGTGTQIDTTEIADKLRENIVASIGEETASDNEKSIEQFIGNICSTYKNVITNTNYEDNINTYYIKISEIMSKAKIAISIAALVDIVIIIILNKNSIHKFITPIGVMLMTSGLIFVVVNKYVYYNIKVNTLTIFNDSISNLLRSILNDILSGMMNYGCIMLGVGIVMMIIYGVIDSKSSKKA